MDTGEATALWKKFQMMKQNLSKISVLFCDLFIFFPDDFDMDPQDIDFDTLRNKADVKGSLHKNLDRWNHIGANPSVIDTIEND